MDHQTSHRLTNLALAVASFVLFITSSSLEVRCAERAAPQVKGQARTVELLYWSNRLTEESEDEEITFTTRFSAGHGGTVVVSIPDSHRRGYCERPWLLQSENPAQHITVRKVSRLSRDRFEETIRDQLGGAEGRELLIFVHGYRSAFEATAHRTGQLAHDLGFDGTVMFFAWPSQGGPMADDYFADELSLTASVPYLVELLQMVRKEAPSAKVHVLAHSSGCHLTCAAVTVMVAADDARRAVDELILAAPDMDTMSFRRVFAQPVTRAAGRVSMYVSTEDMALGLARQYHGNRARLGDACQGVACIPGIETIDVSGTPNEGEEIPTGHRYYALNLTVVEDEARVLKGMPAASRGLRRREVEGKEAFYWTFPTERIQIDQNESR